MKSILSLVFALSCVAATYGAEQRELPVAVFDFEATDVLVSDLGPQVGALLAASLSEAKDIVLVERTDIDKLLHEHELALAGAVTAQTAARVGQLTGAKVLITGRVIRTGDELELVAKVIGTDTGRVFGAVAKGAAADPLGTLTTALSEKIATLIRERGDSLVAPPAASADERIAKLRAATAGKRLPSVHVVTAGSPSDGPIAAMEIESILQRCGFALKERSADIEVAAQSSQGIGARKGALVSCTARVEVRATRKDRSTVFVDQQASVALDLSEAAAAKAARENAAADLGARLVVALAQ
jgi:hypothetical protein